MFRFKPIGSKLMWHANSKTAGIKFWLRSCQKRCKTGDGRWWGWKHVNIHLIYITPRGRYANPKNTPSPLRLPHRNPQKHSSTNIAPIWVEGWSVRVDVTMATIIRTVLAPRLMASAALTGRLAANLGGLKLELDCDLNILNLATFFRSAFHQFVMMCVWRGSWRLKR